MDFEQFNNEFQVRLLELGKKLDGEIKFDEVLKNNSQLHGILFLPKGSNVGIQMYVEDSYRSYQEGMAFNQIAEDLIATFADSEIAKNMPLDVERFFIQENIIPALVPRAGNERMLQEIPHVPFEDLEIIFKFALPDGMATVNEMYLENLGLNEKEFMAMALNNPAYKDNITIAGMSQVISEIEVGRAEVLPVEEEKMFVISNKSRFYGAGSILNEDAMQKVSDILGEDIYILPSSVHECIAVPQSHLPIEELRQMVRDINEDIVDPTERLSDQVYQFDSISKKISIATDALEMDSLKPNIQNQSWGVQSR